MCLLSYIFAMFVASTYGAVSSVRLMPSDDGIPPIVPGGFPGNCAGDTIVAHPINNPFGNILSNHKAPCIFAIVRENVLDIVSETNVQLSYEIINDSGDTILYSNAVSASAFPISIDLGPFAAGHYTLLLYLYNECLEGEFEKGE